MRCAAPSGIAQTSGLARRFHVMIQLREIDCYPDWFEHAPQGPFVSFARRFIRDISAVEAALTLPWSTGPVEGKINKPKLIKRSMFGRPGIELPRTLLIICIENAKYALLKKDWRVKRCRANSAANGEWKQSRAFPRIRGTKSRM